ncbi:hypothetical protein MTsPCn9_34590 [Croceitalea sp. MTPC9]|jgi:hypothetical protein|uniref:hypothetical protein n=1 Tax=unclassified Croceitalea TaxID=2632280 RepID=UPI000C6874BC|nr:hypothetical protein [Allomuricauda sp.]MAU27505.1 hypothetical protein [Allomuricauda sp.]MBC29351.1 hypothetical protein [Allomuricauda sp.]GMN12104.1 hypothetical protein MTsPCn6_34360 [Croceitalea sp. MTPC6]GMN18519.1 hypothetical protein MTsPCn9_34590 [Croceitalea sp. MTPC9]|tara:strand:+ start:2067 stop:2264 length:198 start_codon:yes stop_codon:yes gene_type:complete
MKPTPEEIRDMINEGVDLMGEHFEKWFDQKLQILDGRTAREAMESKEDVRKVTVFLHRMAHGIFS